MHRITPLVLMVIVVTSLSSMLFAVTVEVGNCKSGFVKFGTIQAAVDASPAGSTVMVCPGTYPEQVVINKSLKLKGILAGNSGASVIVAPAGGVVANTTSFSSGNPIAAQLLVQSANGVAVTDITVDGNNNGISSCLPNLIGIFYQNASGTVSRVAAINQALIPSLNGCQNGLGIFVQSDGSGGTSTVTVSNSYAQNFQKNGITGNEAGTTLTASGNTVIGQGPTTGAAENAIQIGFGATGTISNNTAADNIWAPDTISDPGDAAAGLLVFDASNVKTTGNTVASTQFGIAYVEDAVGLADGGTIASNKVSATHIFDGIDVCSDNNTVQSNTVNASDESGIHFDSSCGGTGAQVLVGGNTFNGACAGILLGNLSTPSGSNTFYNVTNKTLSGDTCTPPLARPNAGTHRKFKPARP
jgi:hypothetical protein